MKTTTAKEEGAQLSGLASLANEIEAEEGARVELPAEDPAAAAEQEQQAQAMAALQAGMAKLSLGIFKVCRSILARRLPELREEWTDQVLTPPAEALVPVVNRYLGGLMSSLGDKPELAVFAISLVPLVFGYMDAVDRHDKAEQNTLKAEYLRDPVADAEAHHVG